MQNRTFPRTTVGGISVSRMIIGTNWLLGWSHKGPAADHSITSRYNAKEAFLPLLEAYLEYGIDTLMAPVTQHPLMYEAIQYAQEKTGRKIIVADTPILNVDDTPGARAECEKIIKKSAANGSTFCLMHHSSAEQLVNKNKGVIDRIGDYTAMIRDAGMLPGMTAHMPEIVVYSDANDYDVETYVQIYNCVGFMMQVEVETVAQIIHSAKRPVMTIKPMGAGRCTPFVGLNFSWNTLREKDMIAVGCATAQEVHEDVEISFAALERRLPDLKVRSSPNENQAAFG